MNITPLEIRQKTFEKGFRGYDKDEVNAFLLSLSKELERMIDDHKELKIKHEASLSEVQKLRDVESSLYKTLKTAEDTGANVIEHANKSAELHLKETQMKAEAIMNDAKEKARAMIEKAETEANEVVDEMMVEMKTLESTYKEIESHRDRLLLELKNMAGETMDRVNKFSNKSDEKPVKTLMKKAKAVARMMEDYEEHDKIKKEVSPPQETGLPKEEENKSFFDKI